MQSVALRIERAKELAPIATGLLIDPDAAANKAAQHNFLSRARKQQHSLHCARLLEY